MTSMTPEEAARLRTTVDELSELAAHLEGWRLETTNGQIVLTMMSPNIPHRTAVDVPG